MLGHCKLKTIDAVSRMNKSWLAIGLVFLLGLYVAFLFAKRVVFPDISFDTINYHFFLGKSGANNFPLMFKSSEFFPLGMHSFNPLIDMINHFIYELVGYRLGTIISLLSLLGCFVLSLGIITRVAQSPRSVVAAIFIIPALVINEGMFQVATYFTDNQYSFLALGYVYILMGINVSESNRSFNLRLLYLGVVGGLLITKLTNVIYMIPFFCGTVYFFVSWFRCGLRDDGKKQSFWLALFVYSIPILVLNGIYFLEAYWYTDNPVFPYYNSIFKSIYFPYFSWHFNFGPKNFLEGIIYPYLAFHDPARLGEVKDFFPDVKLLTLFAFTVALSFILVLFKGRLSKKETVFLSITYGSFFVWQMLFGYARYAIALEIMLGLLLVILVNALMRLRFRYYFLILILPCFSFLLWQSYKIVHFNMRYDIAWRPHVDSFTAWERLFFSRDMFIKYTTYNSPLAKQLKHVDVIVQCVNPSSAYAQTFPDLMNKPMLTFDKGSNGAMTSNNNYIKRRDAFVRRAIDKPVPQALSFAIVLNNTNPGLHSLKICMDALKQERNHGRLLKIGKKYVVDNFVGDFRQHLMVFIGSYNSVATVDP